MSARDEWGSPPEIVQCIHRMWTGGADVDVCTNEFADCTIARTGIALPDDGLACRWAGRIYCNPPYSEPHRWVERMAEAGRSGDAEVIGCLRCDPSVSWWRHVWTADAICFPDHRVQFVPPPGIEASQNTGSNALPYWGPDVSRFKWAFRTLGKVYEL